MRLIQHKREAYWFYRFLSLGYDRWVNPLFWTATMRGLALEEARLEPGQAVLDAGAGTGFTTEGIVARVEASQVTMLDQSPHQLARSRAKPDLADCPRVLGDAENLPFSDDSFDRYVSAGSIEYWPDPQRGIAEAYRVTRAGGTALIIGPVRPANRVARFLAETWMLFPPADGVHRLDARRGLRRRARGRARPELYRDQRAPYALAVSCVKRGPAPSPAVLAAPPVEEPVSRARFAFRFVAGSAALRLRADRRGAHAPRPPRERGAPREATPTPARARCAASRAAPRRPRTPPRRPTRPSPRRPTERRHVTFADVRAATNPALVPVAFIRARTPSSARRSQSSGST